VFAREDHTYFFFVAPVDWELNGNNSCFHARVLASISDFEGCYFWFWRLFRLGEAGDGFNDFSEGILLVWVLFLSSNIHKLLFSSEHSRKQEILSMLRVSGPQQTTCAHTHTRTHTIVCFCCF